MKQKLLFPLAVLFVLAGNLLAQNIIFWTTDNQSDRLAK